VSAAPVTPRPRQARSPLALWTERAIELLIRLCGISAVVFVFSIFLFVFIEGAPLITELAWGKVIFSPEWYPTSRENVRYGVGAMIVGTLSVTGLAMLFAVPFGLGAAVFVSEFCTGKVRETLKVVIEMLAAIPSIVWGFIGLSVMNHLIQTFLPAPVGLNLLNAALLLALMSVPIMVSIGEDALKAVPDSYREAGIALGATQMADGHLSRPAARGEATACSPPCCSAWAARSARRWPC
jgi:phosphate transport system permease protein